MRSWRPEINYVPGGKRFHACSHRVSIGVRFGNSTEFRAMWAFCLPCRHTATTAWLSRSKPMRSTSLPKTFTCLNRLNIASMHVSQATACSCAPQASVRASSIHACTDWHCRISSSKSSIQLRHYREHALLERGVSARYYGFRSELLRDTSEGSPQQIAARQLHFAVPPDAANIPPVFVWRQVLR